MVSILVDFITVKKMEYSKKWFIMNFNILETKKEIG